MTGWRFLTNHAWAMLFIARHPDARIRDIAAALDVTERTVHGIVADLVESGYVIREREGRRNRYHVQNDVPLREPVGRQRSIGDLLHLLGDVERGPR
ncbi:MAG: helix-turn-helix domain-containing protein [Ilumatobacteraceae bacterium]